MPRTALLALIAALALSAGCLADEFELIDPPVEELPDECDLDEFTNCVCSLAADNRVLEPECDDNKTPDDEDCICIFDGDCDNMADPGCVCFLEADEEAVVDECVDGQTPDMQGCFCNVQIDEDEDN